MLTELEIQVLIGWAIAFVCIAGVLVQSLRIHRERIAARRNADLYAAFFENSFDGEAITTLEGEFVLYNQALAKVLKVSPKRLETIDWIDMTPEPARSIDLALAQRVIDGELIGYVLDKSYIVDGREIPIRLRVQKIKLPESERYGFLVSIRPRDPSLPMRVVREVPAIKA